MKFTHRMTGHQQLVDGFRRMNAAIQQEVSIAALKDAAEPLRADAAALAPRSEGKGPHMADNIVVEETAFGLGGRVGPDLITVAVGPKKEFWYAEFQEHGTAHHAAHPFMRPAFDANKKLIRKRIADSLWTALRRKFGVR